MLPYICANLFIKLYLDRYLIINILYIYIHILYVINVYVIILHCGLFFYKLIY